METNPPPPRRRQKPNHAAAACRKHPKHRQSPGVCSVCLTEKLTKLSTNGGRGASRANAAATSSSSSSLSSLSSLSSSSEVSSYSSPTHRHFRLTKSKSVASVAWRRGAGGFWSKLLGRRSDNKRVENYGFMHSRTMRETATIVH